MEEIFQAALALDAEARQRHVEQACGQDAELRSAVLRMLAADERAGDAFLPPAAERADPAPAGGGDLEGRRLDRYQVLGLIGEGGSSRVYLAMRADDAYRQRVAIKILETGRAALDADRFRRERQILAALDHPNIAKLLDGGTTPEGAPYLVMELIDGRPIDAYCEARGLATAERLELFLEVARAVAHAHRNLVIHRDLKPSNVLVRGDGRPVLLDFGIAKPVNPELVGDGAPTRFDLLLLTPDYASPEQVRGETCTTASDVYSLGVMLYRLLARQPPYSVAGLGLEELVRTVCEVSPPPPSKLALEPEVARELRGDLDHVVARAMAKRPERRYPSVEQLIEDVERYRDGLPVAARDGGFLYRLAKAVRRHRLAVAAGAVLALAGLGFGIHTFRQSRELAKALALAENERAEASSQRAKAEAIRDFLTGTLLAADPHLGVGKDTTVLDAIGRAEPRLRAAFSDQPEVEAEIRGLLGETYLRLGEIAEAERQLWLTLELQQSHQGRGALATSKTLSALGKLLTAQDRFDEADEAYLEGLDIRRRHLGATDFSTLNTQANLAILRSSQGRFEEADALMAEAYEGYRRCDHPLAPRVAATVLLNRGATVERIGRFREATELTQRADRELTAILGEDHPLVATARTNLGLLHIAAGRPQAARDLLEPARERRTRLLGPEHPQTLETRMGLAKTWLELDDAERARDEIDGVITGLRRVSGPGQQLITSLHVAADVALERGALERGALEDAGRALQEAAALLAEGHDDGRLSVDHRVLSSRLARARGRLDEARTLARQAVDALEPATFDHAVAAAELARALCAATPTEEALAAFRDARAYFDPLLDPGSRTLARLRCDQARCLAAAGHPADTADLEAVCEGG